jgi:hypothetical protein
MSKEFLGLAQVALASSALVIPGCGGERSPPDGQQGTSALDAVPPSIVSAALGEGVLTLRFSKAVAPPSGVDPSKFRLTFGYKNSGRDSYHQDYYYASSHVERTWYTDVGRFSADTTKLRQPAADIIQIPLPKDLNASWVCDDIARLQRRGNAAPGLYLHYAEPGGSAIMDRNGNRLRSVAPYWMTNESSAVPGEFANKPIAVGVRCR